MRFQVKSNKGWRGNYLVGGAEKSNELNNKHLIILHVIQRLLNIRGGTKASH